MSKSSYPQHSIAFYLEEGSARIGLVGPFRSPEKLDKVLARMAADMPSHCAPHAVEHVTPTEAIAEVLPYV